jgi:hypothetical protein
MGRVPKKAYVEVKKLLFERDLARKPAREWYYKTRIDLAPTRSLCSH